MIKNKYNNCDDVSSVTGVKSTDRLLIIGDSTPLEFMKKYVNSVITCNEDELSSDLVKDQYFDKIFVCESKGDKSDLTHIFEMSVGTVTFFIEDDERRNNLQDYIDAYWYPSTSWDLTSNVGKCLITDAQGRSIQGSEKEYSV